MAIVLESTVFKTQVGTGEDFSENSGDSVQVNFNVWERCQITQIVKNVVVTQNKILSIGVFSPPLLYNENNIISRVQGSFITDGFKMGQEILYENVGTSTVHISGRIITAITNSQITFNGPTVAPIIDSGAILRGKPTTTDFRYDYGFPVSSSATVLYASRLNGSPLGYSIGSVGAGSVRDTNYVNGIWISQIKAPLSLRNSFKMRFIDYSGFEERFEIIHEFLSPDIYKDGENSNHQTGTPPAEYLGSSDIEYGFKLAEIESVSLSNVIFTSKNTVIQHRYTAGGRGWYNEEFNGSGLNFTKHSINYSDSITGAIVSGLQVDRKTSVTCVIAKSNDSNSSDHRISVGVITQRISSSYVSSPLNYEDLFAEEDVYQTFLGGTPANGTIITDLICSDYGVDPVNFRQIDFNVEYANSQQTSIAVTDNYTIGVLCGVAGLVGVQKRETLLMDSSQYTDLLELPGLVTLTDHKFFTLGQNLSGAGNSDARVWPGSNLLHEFNLNVEAGDGAIWKYIKAYIAIYNNSTGEFQEWPQSQFLLDLDQFPTVSGVQQVSMSKSRNYQRESGDPFNEISIETGAQVGSVVPYTVKIPHMITWMKYFVNANVPQTFFSWTAPFLGKHFGSATYSGQQGFEFVVFVDLIMESQGILTEYRFSTPAIKVLGYGIDTPEPNDTTGDIKTFAGAQEITGAVASNETTRIEVKFTKNAGSFNANSWGEIRLEGKNRGNVENVWLINTEYNPLDDITNGLVPQTGQTKCKKTINAGVMTLECEIDHTDTDQAWSGVTISSEWGLDSPSSDTDDEKIDEIGLNKTAESGVTKTKDV